MAFQKIEGMIFRHLSEAEIKWLRGKMSDASPEISAAAREAHNMKFPHYERNIMKKGLTARKLEFFIHGGVWDEYGDEMTVHMRFFLDNTGVLRRTDYDAPEAERETQLDVGKPVSVKFLKAVVQQLNAPFWAEDLSDGEYEDDGLDESDEEDSEQVAERGEPLWSITLDLNKGGMRTISFYNQMHDEPQELFRMLMEWFESEEYEESDEEEDYEENCEEEFDE